MAVTEQISSFLKAKIVSGRGVDTVTYPFLLHFLKKYIVVNNQESLRKQLLF